MKEPFKSDSIATKTLQLVSTLNSSTPYYSRTTGITLLTVKTFSVSFIADLNTSFRQFDVYTGTQTLGVATLTITRKRAGVSAVIGTYDIKTIFNGVTGWKSFPIPGAKIPMRYEDEYTITVTSPNNFSVGMSPVTAADWMTVTTNGTPYTPLKRPAIKLYTAGGSLVEGRLHIMDGGVYMRLKGKDIKLASEVTEQEKAAWTATGVQATATDVQVTALATEVHKNVKDGVVTVNGADKVLFDSLARKDGSHNLPSGGPYAFQLIKPTAAIRLSKITAVITSTATTLGVVDVWVRSGNVAGSGTDNTHLAQASASITHTGTQEVVFTFDSVVELAGYTNYYLEFFHKSGHVKAMHYSAGPNEEIGPFTQGWKYDQENTTNGWTSHTTWALKLESDTLTTCVLSYNGNTLSANGEKLYPARIIDYVVGLKVTDNNTTFVQPKIDATVASTDTAIGLAKTEAITAATTKANTAKTEAIAAAATDATTKANAAKTEAVTAAKAYTDTKSLLKSNVTNKATFDANREAVRNELAGSGFVEWGKHVNSGTMLINQGMYSPGHAWGSSSANTVYMGRAGSDGAGSSKTTVPIVNVAGVTHRITGINYSSINAIKLPPAPNSAAMPNRQDFIYLESWCEKVADTDRVYPLGNVQFVNASFEGVPTVVGTFTGADTYSLFGDWQTAGALVGRGVKWSTATSTQKQKILAESKHNLVMIGDELHQWRYRTKTQQGNGVPWVVDVGIDAPGLGWHPRSNLSYNLYAQGSKVAHVPPGTEAGRTTKSIYWSNGTVIRQAYWRTDAIGNRGTVTPGLLVAGRVNIAATDVSATGDCYMLPVAIVERYNTGAYHPKYNTNGTGRWKHTSAATNHEWWEAGSRGMTATSIADCFDETKTVVSVIDQPSGRPDGKVSDAIYESMVKDLRTSALRKPDTEILRDELQSLVSGTARGWESGVKLTDTPWTSVFGYNSNAEVVLYSNYILDTLYVTRGGYTEFDYNGNTYHGTFYELRSTYVKVKLIDTTLPPIPAGNTALTGKVRVFDTNNVYSDDQMICEVIGHPKNYPSNMGGVPYLVDEDGVSTLPPVGVKTYKLRRKIKAIHQVLTSSDNGATWNDSTAPIIARLNLVNNTTYATLGIDGLMMIFYSTKSSRLDYATNTHVDAIADVTAGEFHSHYSPLSNDLLDKVVTGAAGNSVVTNTVAATTTPEGLLPVATNNVYAPPSHTPFDLHKSASPCVKYLPYLTTIGGVKHINFAFEELKHNGAAWGDDGKIRPHDKRAYRGDSNGVLVLYGTKSYKTNQLEG